MFTSFEEIKKMEALGRAAKRLPSTYQNAPEKFSLPNQPMFNYDKVLFSYVFRGAIWKKLKSDDLDSGPDNVLTNMVLSDPTLEKIQEFLAKDFEVGTNTYSLNFKELFGKDLGNFGSSKWKRICH